MMFKKRFFIPFIGSNYNQGINKKKLLVLGASFYCPHTECKLYTQCTDVNIKSSVSCDNICPIYSPDGKQLHNEPSYSIDDAPKPYQNFASFIKKYVGCEDYAEIWSHLAFTNYVQFFLPAIENKYRETRWSDLSERDFDAFVQTVKELSPDIIVVWGCVINLRLKERNPYVIDKDSLPSTEGYLCHMKISGIKKQISILNPYHPSSSAWYSALDVFEKYFNQALQTK